MSGGCLGFLNHPQYHKGNRFWHCLIPEKNGSRFNDPLEPQTTMYKWTFGETTIFYIKIWNHPTETSIYKWLFRVPGPVSNIPPFFHRTHGARGERVSSSPPWKFPLGRPDFPVQEKWRKVVQLLKCRDFWNLGGWVNSLTYYPAYIPAPSNGWCSNPKGFAEWHPLPSIWHALEGPSRLSEVLPPPYVPEHVLKVILDGSQQLPQQLPPLPRYNDPLQPSVRWYQWTHHWAWPPEFFRAFKVAVGRAPLDALLVCFCGCIDTHIGSMGLVYILHLPCRQICQTRILWILQPTVSPRISLNSILWLSKEIIFKWKNTHFRKMDDDDRMYLGILGCTLIPTSPFGKSV